MKSMLFTMGMQKGMAGIITVQELGTDAVSFRIYGDNAHGHILCERRCANTIPEKYSYSFEYVRKTIKKRTSVFLRNQPIYSVQIFRPLDSAEFVGYLRRMLLNARQNNQDQPRICRSLSEWQKALIRLTEKQESMK